MKLIAILFLLLALPIVGLFLCFIIETSLCQYRWYRKLMGGVWYLERPPKPLRLEGMNDFWRRPQDNEDYKWEAKMGRLLEKEDYR